MTRDANGAVGIVGRASLVATLTAGCGPQVGVDTAGGGGESGSEQGSDPTGSLDESASDDLDDSASDGEDTATEPPPGATQPCWSWSASGTDWVNAVAAAEEGDVIAVGAAGAEPRGWVGRFDPQGGLRWQASFDRGSAYSDVIVLEGGEVIAVGHANDPGAGAIVHAYDGSGAVLWTTAVDVPDTRFASVWWWPGALRLVAVGADDAGIPLVQSFDVTGAADTTFETAEGLRYPHAASGLGEGFAVCGSIDDGSIIARSGVTAYGPAGEMSWTSIYEQPEGSYCGALVGVPTGVLAAINAQRPADPQPPGDGGWTESYMEIVNYAADGSVNWAIEWGDGGDALQRIVRSPEGRTFVATAGFVVSLGELDDAGGELWYFEYPYDAIGRLTSALAWSEGRLYVGGVDIVPEFDLQGYVECHELLR